MKYSRRNLYKKQELLTHRVQLGSPPFLFIFLFYFFLEVRDFNLCSFSVVLPVSLYCPFVIASSIFSFSSRLSPLWHIWPLLILRESFHMSSFCSEFNWFRRRSTTNKIKYRRVHLVCLIKVDIFIIFILFYCMYFNIKKTCKMQIHWGGRRQLKTVKI